VATTVFQVSLFSSYRFANESPVSDGRYHTMPFDDRFDPTNYFQKVQKDDNNLRVQLLSDFVPTLALYDCHDKFIKDIPFTSRTIQNASFLVYDAVPDYTGVAEGSYYLKLTYTDENSVVQDLRTSPLNVADDWEGTLLLEYTNTFNDKGVIFVNDDKSLLVFGFRIEASFDEYQPLSDDIDYIDQVHDSEVLNNTPYDNEKLYIGTDQVTGGAPDWAIKKMNLIFTLNKVAIDNQYYNRVDGSKFSPTRPDHGELINGANVRPTYWSIDIIPNLNFNLQQLNTGDIPTGDIIVIKKAWPLTPTVFTGSFSVAGVFTDNTNLIRLALWNNGLDAFDVLIGTTPGAQDIAKFEVTADLTNSLDIGHPFNSATTVYVTMPDGVNVKAYLDYNQYDSAAIDPIAPTSFGFKGMTMIYTEITEGDFALDFNIATGLGLRNYVGWALCDGQNDTQDRTGKYSRCWNKSLPLTRGTRTGNENSQLIQTEDQVGRHRHLTPNSNDASGYGKPATGDRPQEGPDMYTNYNRDTEAEPMDISPDSLEDVWIVKITD